MFDLIDIFYVVVDWDIFDFDDVGLLGVFFYVEGFVYGVGNDL